MGEGFLLEDRKAKSLGEGDYIADTFVSAGVVLLATAVTSNREHITLPASRRYRSSLWGCCFI
jgi:hypothetical protein